MYLNLLIYISLSLFRKAKLRFMYGKWTSYIRSLEVQHHEEYLRLKELVPVQQGSEGQTAPANKEHSSLFNKIHKKKAAPVSEMSLDDNFDFWKLIGV